MSGIFAHCVVNTYPAPHPSSLPESEMPSIRNLPRTIATAVKSFSFRRRRRHRNTLLDLPNELLLQIALYLPPDIAAINALLRTTHFLSHLLTPILYTHAMTPLLSSGTLPLRASCTAGKIHAVRSLLAHGVPINTQELSSYGTTALHAAIMLKQAPVVALLLQEGADVNQADENGWTPLHWAVMSRERSIVSTLLAHGAITDVRGRFGGGATPLHFAAGGGSAGGMVGLLLEWGAGVEVGDYDGITPIQYAITVQDEEAVGLMVRHRGVGLAPTVGARARRTVRIGIRICQNWWMVSELWERLCNAKWVSG